MARVLLSIGWVKSMPITSTPVWSIRGVMVKYAIERASGRPLPTHFNYAIRLYEGLVGGQVNTDRSSGCGYGLDRGRQRWCRPVQASPKATASASPRTDGELIA